MNPESAALLAAAADKLQAAQILLEAGLNDDVASRAYYAVFHAISALHLENGNAFSSRAQTIGRFNKDFVRTGIFSPVFTRIVTRLFEDRQLGDYDATSKIPPDQAAQDLLDARAIVEAIQIYIRSGPPKASTAGLC